jgi:hypothetical protein
MATDSEASFKLYGLPLDNGQVRADVFVSKLKAFIEALKLSDSQANQRKSHDFIIVGLGVSSAEATVRERPSRVNVNRASGVRFMQNAITAIEQGRTLTPLDIPLELVQELAELPKGIGETFTFGEIAFDHGPVIRVDDRFAVQLQRTIKELTEEATEQHFKGISLSTFDGVLKILDHLGKIVRGTLILTAGGAQIDCVFDSSNLPNLRDSFDKRARIEAIAHYDGISDLPQRLDVKRIVPVKGSADLLRWKGSLRPKRKKRPERDRF